MRFLRSNTAVIVTVGPFYDKTDGVTIETALTITNERITLTADTDDGSAPTNILDNVTGATSGTSNDLNYISGNDAGMMQLELSAANTNRVGRMLLSITDAANHVPVFHEFMVLPAAIYDWLIAGTIVPVPANVTTWNGTAVATPDTAGHPKVTIKDGTGQGEIATTSGKVDGVVLTDTVTTYTGNTPQTGDCYTKVDTEVASILAAVDTEIGALQTDVTAIKAKTDNLPSDPADQSLIIAATDAIKADTAATLAAVDTEVASILAAVVTEVADIKAKTDNLPSDPADHSAIIAATDAITTAVAAVQADTDNIQTRLPAALVGGRMDSSVGATAADVITDSAMATSAVDKIADKVWDEAFAGHVGAGSFGKMLNDLTEDDGAVRRFTTNALEQAPAGGGGSSESRNREGTAQAGGASTITLDAGASAVNDFYKNQRCFIDAGTGAGQCEFVASYVGSTKVCTMAAAWATAPDATSHFRLLPMGTIPGASAPSADANAEAVANKLATMKVTVNRQTGDVKHFMPDGTTPRGTRRIAEVDPFTQGLIPQ